jgi:hypothetical protein
MEKLTSKEYLQRDENNLNKLFAPWMGKNYIRDLLWLYFFFFHTNKGIFDFYGIRGFWGHGNGNPRGKKRRAKDK